MKNLILIFIVVYFVNCRRNNKDIPIGVPQQAKVVSVILAKDTTSQISCRVDRTLVDSEEQLYISFNNQDTLNIPIKNPAFLFVGSKFSLSDTLLVYPGDTIRVMQRNKAIYYTSHDKFEWPKLNHKELVDLSVKIDSISEFFYGYGYSMPVNNDYSSTIIRSLNIKHEVIKKNPTLYDKLVSMRVKHYYLKKNAYKHLYGEESELLKILVEELKYKLFKDLGTLHNVNNNSIAIDYCRSDLFINDSLPNTLHAYSYVRNYIEDVVLEGEVDWSKSKMYIDYKKGYDLLPDHLSGEVLKYAKRICLENMFEVGEDHISIDKYYKQYCSEYRDTIFQKSFEARYTMNFSDLKGASVDLNLIDEDQKTWTLTDILAINRGKLIYIDFWASWCGPCRVAMPASRELKKKYENKGVAFIYFSIDKNQEHWMAASKSEKITTNNFLVLNNESAQFSKDINMSSIPRYLLFDKKGKLVHQEAPGPGGSQIHRLMDKYLVQ